MEKETIELVKKMIEDGNLSQEIAEKYCPELKESEDERIKKWLICTLKSLNNSPVQIDGAYEMMLPAIAWLEKQGEHSAKNIVEAWKDMRLEVYQQASGNRHEPNYSDDTTKMFSLNDIDEIIEKISELKPVNEVLEKKPLGKIEPKFKVGDWVMLDRPVLITKVEDMPYNTHQYWTSDGTWFGDSTKAKLWTIQDSKDGDVLVSNDASFIVLFKGLSYLEDNIDRFKSYCHCREGIFSPIKDPGWCCNAFHPATKEQRDLLFQKMKDAGYEWDTEHKQLKKIEQKPAEWRKEDELMVDGLLKYFISRMQDAFIEKATKWIEKNFNMPDDFKEHFKKAMKL